MKIEKTPFEGLLIIEPKVFDDSRGSFYESYNERTFHDLGIEVDFVQDNQSNSRKGVLRGLHFQAPPYGQVKLIRVLSGTIQDVVVDLRRGHSTFGKYYSIELSATNRKQLLVPLGFAHGFLVLSDEADVLYKCSSYYRPDAEGGIRHDDPQLSIDWQMEKGKRIVSAKDLILPPFSEAFVF